MFIFGYISKCSGIKAATSIAESGFGSTGTFLLNENVSFYHKFTLSNTSSLLDENHYSENVTSSRFPENSHGSTETGDKIDPSPSECFGYTFPTPKGIINHQTRRKTLQKSHLQNSLQL
jgi:hypothetical protein